MKRALLVILAMTAGCGGTVDSYTGIDAAANPGVSALTAAEKSARQMVSTARGNYREPYYEAFWRLKTAQERWLGAPRAGAPTGKHLTRWRLTYRDLGQVIFRSCRNSKEKKKLYALDLDMASRGIAPFLTETEAEMARRKAQGN